MKRTQIPKSRERVLLNKPKTLVEVSQYARFSEAVLRVANNTTAQAYSTVNLTNFSLVLRGQNQRFFGKPQRGKIQSNARGSYNRGTLRGSFQGPPQLSVTKNFNSQERTVNVLSNRGMRAIIAID